MCFIGQWFISISALNAPTKGCIDRTESLETLETLESHSPHNQELSQAEKTLRESENGSQKKQEESDGRRNQRATRGIRGCPKLKFYCYQWGKFQNFLFITNSLSPFSLSLLLQPSAISIT